MLINILVDVYARNGKSVEAIGIYRRIPEQIRDTISHGSVLNACSHAGLIDEARHIFRAIKKKNEIIVASMVCILLNKIMNFISQL